MLSRLIAGASLVLLVAVIKFATMVRAGDFSGGPAACGTWGFDCLGHALVLVGCGSTVGTLMALAALALGGKRSVLCWAALVLNGVTAAGLLLLGGALLAVVIYVTS